MKLVVIALGGNQLAPIEGAGDNAAQFYQTNKTAEVISNFVKEYPEVQLAITHGNGPQVGTRLLRSIYANKYENIYTDSLDICGAETQGFIGYMIQQSLLNKFSKKRIKKKAVSLVTQVLVDKNDPAFNDPTKFIGPGYSKSELEDKKIIDSDVGKFIVEENGSSVIYKEYKTNVYRKVVPSPEPLRIIELDTIVSLIRSGTITISVGGGGIPVIETQESLKGVEAVIDKDKATALLASKLSKNYEVTLIILTAVDSVYLNFGKKDIEYSLSKMSVKTASKYIKEGHFPPGSMKPKVEAGIFALQNGVHKVIITSPEFMTKAWEGRAGTIMYRGL